MFKQILLAVFGVIVGAVIGYIITFQTPVLGMQKKDGDVLENLHIKRKEVIGFLPYWLIPKAENKDYSPYITTLTYFGLTIDPDGTIQKYTDADQMESEPGWHALQSGRIDKLFEKTRNQGKKLSLLIFAGSGEDIDRLMDDPIHHANNLMDEVLPVMKKYAFSDLNLDIESTKNASPESRIRFTKFMEQVNDRLDAAKAGTLTVEVTGNDLIRDNLINPKEVGRVADYLVIMAYDYHYPGSAVTGAVAPLAGAGTSAEYDAQTAANQALKLMPAKKVILGVPLYGYQWETIGNTLNSAVIPGTGLTASTERVEKFLQECATCSAEFNIDSQEAYVIYKDIDTNTFYQISYPNYLSTFSKISFALEKDLGGLALWALGYEDSKILEPLKDYR